MVINCNNQILLQYQQSKENPSPILKWLLTVTIKFGYNINKAKKNALPVLKLLLTVTIKLGYSINITKKMLHQSLNGY